MPIGFLFWTIMVLWLIFGIWRAGGDRYLIGSSILTFVLFFLLGWRVFGFVIQG